MSDFNWGKSALNVQTTARFNHSFNAGVVGRGTWHHNELVKGGAVGNRFVIKLNIGIYWDAKQRLLRNSIPFLCLVDTGATHSLFMGEVAHELDLTPHDPFLAEGTLADGSSKGAYWSEQVLAIALGPGSIDVRVWFPVEAITDHFGQKVWKWKTGTLDENVVGMNDVLSRWMLCFTPETLFVFERRPTPVLVPTLHGCVFR